MAHPVVPTSRTIVAIAFAAIAMRAWCAPSVDSLSPQSGPTAGATIATITGSGFTPDTAVRFNRTPAGVVFVDASHLRVTTPPLGGGPFATALAAVRVSNASGTTYAEFLYLPPRFDEIGIGDITTIAGVGNFVGEGRLATKAPVNAQAFAFDTSGNLFLGEETGGRVRKVGADGRIVTVGGTGVVGYSGDGGRAEDAQFNWPAAVAVDRTGNVYVADAFGNHRVRRIDAATGIVRTIAGTGRAGYSGDGGAATQAQLDTPYASLAIDSRGNVYIVDTGNQRVRRIDAAGLITTVAGNGTSGFSGDGGPATQASFRFGLQVGTLAIDSGGNLFVVDFDNHRVRRIGIDGRVQTVAGGGSRPPAEGMAAIEADTIFNSVAVDAQDRLLFTDDTHIWRLDADGRLARIAGTGERGLSSDGVAARDAAMIVGHLGVSPRGEIHVSETVAGRIRRIDAASGRLATAAGMGPAAIGDDGASALAAAFTDIGSIALDPRGLLVGDPRGGLRIRRVDASGTITTVAGTGIPAIPGFYREGISATAGGLAPHAIQSDAQGVIYYNDFCAVRRIGADGAIRTVVGPLTSIQQCGFGGDGGPGTGALIGSEQGRIRLDAEGNVFIADPFNQRIRRWDAASGTITTFAGSGPASGTDGYFHGTGGFAGDGGPAAQALLNSPGDVAVDSRRGVCIADQGNFRVRCVDAQGAIRTVAGGGADYPGDGGPATAAIVNAYRVAADPSGNLFIGDSFDGTIRKVDAAGVISTVAGSRRNRGFSGDGAPALQAQIDHAADIAVDASGNIVFFDGDNRRVRVIKRAATLGIGAPPTTNADTPGALSGLWWNPSESGWGIDFTQRRNIVFAAWYTYDAAGDPKWYVASRCALPSASPGGTCSDTLYEVSGPRFFGAPFDAAAVRVTPAGTLRLDFRGPDDGTLTYTLGTQTRTVPITRQIFQAGTTRPPVDYTDLWWNPAESGWGLAVTHQFGVMFLAWYVYDASGKPVWYVAADCRVLPQDQGCSGTLYRTTGPASGQAFDPSQVRVFSVGTVTLHFTDANHGVLGYTVDGVTSSKTITRQLF